MLVIHSSSDISGWQNVGTSARDQPHVRRSAGPGDQGQPGLVLCRGHRGQRSHPSETGPCHGLKPKELTIWDDDMWHPPVEDSSSSTYIAMTYGDMIKVVYVISMFYMYIINLSLADILQQLHSISTCSQF